jgi:hypothetical protein
VAELQTSTKPRGLTRGKAITIAVLGVVLVVVLYLQFGRSDDKPLATAAVYHPPRPAAAAKSATTPGKPQETTVAKAASGKVAAAAQPIDEKRWKAPPLVNVVSYDPFALPASFPQPPKMTKDGKPIGSENVMAAAAADDAKHLTEALLDLKTQLEDLKQKGASVIMREGDHYVAMIGDRMVRVGDEIDRFTVTKIDPADGVHVERKDLP